MLALGPLATEKTTKKSDMTLSRRAFLSGAVAAASIVTCLPQAQASISLAEFFWPKNDGIGVSHRPWSYLLKKYRIDGRDNTSLMYYSRMRPEQGILKSYIDDLAKTRPSGLGRADAAAYWINLYNALTVDVILDHYPVNSILEIDLTGDGQGPWRKKLVMIEGKKLSLDDIEYHILIPTLGDPKVHYALNTGALSCPALQPAAFSRGNLGNYLRRGARQYINSSRGVKVESGKIIASSIYDWYLNDFGGKDSLRPHWQIYADTRKYSEIEEARISGFSFDWRLNDA